MIKKSFEITTLSVKNLASLAMPDSCERCFWIKSRMGFKAPWSSFPGIFGNIDSYSKKVTETWMREFPGEVPSWMTELGTGAKQIDCPHWSKFSFKDLVTGIALRGTPDERFLLADGTVAILDYKTSSYAADKVDSLMPIYRVQLAGYRWLTLKLEQRETSVTSLIYYSPPDKIEMSALGKPELTSDGFNMRFRAHVVPVRTDLQEVESLLVTAKRIVTSPIPAGLPGCKDCAMLTEIQGMLA